MKKLLMLVLSLAMLLCSVSCSASYVDDKDAKGVIGIGLTALDDGVEYLPVEPDFLGDYFKAPTWVKEHEIRIAANASNLNQVGIYHVEEGHAKEMKETLSNYLAKALEKNEAWYDSYIPEETPKLRDAEVRVFGNYVAYAILDAEDRATFFDAIEAELKA